MSQGNTKGIVIAVAAVGAAAALWFFSRRSEPEREKKKEVKTAETPAVQKSKYPVGARVSTTFGAGTVEAYRAEDQIYTVVLDADEGYSQNRSFVSEDGLSEFRPKFDIGSKVLTPYGPGKVKDYRDSDKIYGVQYTWDDNGTAVGYLTKDALEPFFELSSEPSERAENKFPASGDEAKVQEWLKEHGFDDMVRDRLKAYSGARLLKEVKKELLALSGGREGLRLWQILHPEGSEVESDTKQNPVGASRSLPSAEAEKPAEEEEDEEEGDEEEEEEGPEEH